MPPRSRRAPPRDRMDNPDVSAVDVGRAHQLVNDHLKAYDAGKRYDCSDNAPSKEEIILNNTEEDATAAVTKYISVGRNSNPRAVTCRPAVCATSVGRLRGLWGVCGMSAGRLRGLWDVDGASVGRLWGLWGVCGTSMGCRWACGASVGRLWDAVGPVGRRWRSRRNRAVPTRTTRAESREREVLAHIREARLQPSHTVTPLQVFSRIRDARLHRYTRLQVLPRIKEAMRPPPPFFVEGRAAELIKGWHAQGIRALQPRTIAACAMYIACDDLKSLMGEARCHTQSRTVTYDFTRTMRSPSPFDRLSGRSRASSSTRPHCAPRQRSTRKRWMSASPNSRRCSQYPTVTASSPPQPVPNSDGKERRRVPIFCPFFVPAAEQPARHVSDSAAWQLVACEVMAHGMCCAPLPGWHCNTVLLVSRDGLAWGRSVFLESLLEIRKVEPFSLSGKFPGN